MGDTDIVKVVGRRVWDSRGRPTVEAEVTLAGGAMGRAIAPAGASTGSGEAVDLRDGGKAFGGYDVTRAVASVNGEIATTLRGLDSTDQETVDNALIRLDGTDNRSRLGGNAMIATSLAVAHASAAASRVPLWRYLAGTKRFRRCPGRRSSSSAAAPTPAGGSTSRTSWWSRRARRPLPKPLI